MSEAAIVTHDLSKRYGEIHAVDRLSIEVPKGVIAGFVGPNGSGKTTTIRMLLSQVRPTSGTAEVLGVPVTHPFDVLPKVGALIESPTFYPGLSGRDNLRALACLGRISYGRVDDLLEMVGLSARAKQRVTGYSLGMRQRLGIAAALLPDPELLILDEPANGLDPEGITEMRTLLRSQRDLGKTVFISSHLLGELEQLADWLVAIRGGSLMFAGRTRDMLSAQVGELILRPRMPADAPRLLEIVRGLGAVGDLRDDRVRIQNGDDELAAKVNTAAMDAGIVLVGIHTEQPSLEQSFLAMVAGD